MNSDSFENLEQRLAAIPPRGAPSALRSAVFDDVHRELSAARWDRLLARAAAILLVVGVGMNAAIGVWPAPQPTKHLIAGPMQHSFVQLAVSVAEATDVQTGRRYARHMATLTGRTLTGDDVAAIDAAVNRQVSPAMRIGDEG